MRSCGVKRATNRYRSPWRRCVENGKWKQENGPTFFFGVERPLDEF